MIDGGISVVLSWARDTFTGANKPWISKATLDLLDERRQARLTGQFQLELDLRRRVKKSARCYRSMWLEQSVADGSWNAVKKLSRGRKVQQGRLRNAAGEIVSTEFRATTLAEHLETAQWKTRTVSLVPEPCPALRSQLPIDVDAFKMKELRRAIGRMKSGKATKDNDVPIEAFKGLAQEGD